jgi:uncharacterized membrane protein YdcZ (DUF606 family)
VSWYLLIPVGVGVLAVFQSGLNRQMGAEFGLGSAIFWNCVMSFLLSGALYGVVRWSPEWLPKIFQGGLDLKRLSWWMLFPGLFGVGIVAGLPWAISRLGSAKVFVGMVAAQIVVSLAWDAISGERPLSWVRVLGAALAIGGALLVTLDRD